MAYRTRSRSARSADERPAGATVRIGPLTPIPAVLRELGFAPEPLLRAAGFDLSCFDDADLTISYLAGGRLLAHCVAATGCDHFGLRVGMRGDAALLGLTGFLVMSAGDVGGALDDLVRHLDLGDTGGVPYVETAGERSVLAFALVDPATPAVDQIYDLSMAVACNLMRALCGPRWSPTEVLLPRSRPPDPTPWAQFFRAPVRFGAGSAAVVFPARWLAVAVPSANAHLHRHFEREAAQRHRERATSFADEVRRIVSTSLARGKCTVTRVAALLGMHARTLNRRLVVEGTTFKALRDDIRYEMSRQLLGRTAMTLGEIATALGYAEGSVFLRAFARWSGRTPQQWRDAQPPTAAMRPARSNGRA